MNHGLRHRFAVTQNNEIAVLIGLNDMLA